MSARDTFISCWITSERSEMEESTDRELHVVADCSLSGTNGTISDDTYFGIVTAGIELTRAGVVSVVEVEVADTRGAEISFTVSWGTTMGLPFGRASGPRSNRLADIASIKVSMGFAPGSGKGFSSLQGVSGRGLRALCRPSTALVSRDQGYSQESHPRRRHWRPGHTRGNPDNSSW